MDEHDHGLAHDMKVMRALDRRRALRLFAGASGLALVGACGEGDGSSGSVTVSTTPTPSPTPTPTPTSTATPTPTSGCIADPAETAGPYPADGTNRSSGSTSNALTASGIVRSDIRPSFLNNSTTVAQGVEVTLTLTLVDVNTSCNPLAGYAIYIWHCDRDGSYSLYSVPAESYLRGVLVTDADGKATFTTIFPACYSGRYPHIHFEVFSSLSNATSGQYSVLTSQLAMPADMCRDVYNNADGYSASISRFSQITTASDNVFGDNSSAQIAQQTPAFDGSISAGYTASATIGIAT